MVLPNAPVHDTAPSEVAPLADLAAVAARYRAPGPHVTALVEAFPATDRRGDPYRGAALYDHRNGAGATDDPHVT